MSKATNFSKVSYVESKPGLCNIQSRKKKQLDSATLAKRCNVYQKKALKTVKLMTPRGIRSALRPSLSRWYPTNDLIIGYNCLPRPVFSDTLKSGVLSKRGNQYDEAYRTQYGWSRCHPMRLKSEAHESSLSVLF